MEDQQGLCVLQIGVLRLLVDEYLIVVLHLDEGFYLEDSLNRCCLYFQVRQSPSIRLRVVLHHFSPSQRCHALGTFHRRD